MKKQILEQFERISQILTKGMLMEQDGPSLTESPLTDTCKESKLGMSPLS